MEKPEQESKEKKFSPEDMTLNELKGEDKNLVVEWHAKVDRASGDNEIMRQMQEVVKKRAAIKQELEKRGEQTEE